jgi:hypothetical protein
VLKGQVWPVVGMARKMDLSAVQSHGSASLAENASDVSHSINPC